MRVFVSIMCVSLSLSTGAQALSQEFLERVIDQCLDGVAAGNFPNMTEDSRFLGLTRDGAMLAMIDPSGVVEVHVSLDPAVFKSMCSFRLKGEGAVSDKMVDFFVSIVGERGFVRTLAKSDANFEFLKCETPMIEAKYRRFVQRNEASFAFSSRPVSSDECDRG